jgi:hypothetical protein
MMRVSMRGVRAIMAVAAATFVSATAAATVSINIGSTRGAPGATATFQVALDSGGAQVGGVQNTILFDPATPIASCVIHPALAGLSNWSLQPQGCTPLVNCTQANFVILLFGAPIPDGLLYQCDVKIAVDAADGILPLRCSGARAGDPGGQVLPVQCVEGQVEVVRPTPTATATSTASPTTPPTPTPTTPPTPTASPNPPTGTPEGTPTMAAGPSMPTSWEDNDSCQIVSAGGGSGWLLLVPAAVLLVLRRRCG